LSSREEEADRLSSREEEADAHEGKGVKDQFPDRIQPTPTSDETSSEFFDP
jgi:hypothetical protein